MTSIQIRVRAPSGALSLSISASSTFGDLRQRIEDDLKLSQDFDLLIGFPPAILAQEDEESIFGVISNNENIRVQLKELSGVQAQGVTKRKRKTPSHSNAASKEPQPLSFGAKVHSIKKTDTVSTSFLVSSPQQRRGEASAPKPKRQRRSSKAVTAGSENDICEDLLAAVNGAAGSKNKMLRKALRNTVLGQYNESKAISRLGAIYSNKYQIVEKSTARVLGSGVSTQIEVTFPKGAGNRGTYTETVDLLPKDGLLVLIRLPLLHAKSNSNSSSSSSNQDEGSADYVAEAGDALEQGREVLKPANLSKCSPRLFWSLVHHYGPNVYETLRDILREIDGECSWLEERKRELSEKAKANLAQKEQQEAEQRSKKGSNKKAKTEGSSSSSSVVEVVDLIGGPDGSSSGPTAAAPPLFSGGLSKDSKLPPSWIAHFNSTIETDSILPSEWLQPLLAVLSGDSSKQDADCSSYSLLRALSHLPNTSSARNQLVDASLKGTESSEPPVYARVLPLPVFSSWVTSAQGVLMNDFWCEVVCGGSAMLKAALGSLRIRTPTELLVWKRGLPGLMQGLLRFNPALGELRVYSHCEDGYSVMNEARLVAVCEMCETLKSELAWVSNFKVNHSTSREPPAAQQQGEDEQEEGWTSEHPLVGKRVRVEAVVDEDEEQEEEGSYWAEGTIVSYLPPEEDEPMALWRVRVDPIRGSSSSGSSGSGVVVKDVIEDLEEEEVNLAVEKWQTAHA